MTISARELMLRTGASYRQIDYWCGTGIIKPIGKPNPGSGYRREFDEEAVSRIKLVATLARAFGHTIPKEVLGQIFKNYENGHFYLGEGVELRWKVNGDDGGKFPTEPGE